VRSDVAPPGRNPRAETHLGFFSQESIMKITLMVSLVTVGAFATTVALAEQPGATPVATPPVPAASPIAPAPTGPVGPVAPVTSDAATTPSTPSSPATLPTSTTTTTSADTDGVPVTRAGGENTTLYNKVRPNKAMLITGGFMFAGAYATTAALTAASDGSNVDKTLYIPVVGPWAHLGDSSATATNNTADTLLVAGSGVIQGVGVGLAIASLFVPEKVASATVRASNGTKVQFAPTSYGVGSAGFGAVGTF